MFIFRIHSKRIGCTLPGNTGYLLYGLFRHSLHIFAGGGFAFVEPFK